VANRLGAMAEVVTEEKDGILAEPFSAESMSSKIQQLINQPELCTMMGSAGKSRILNEFNRTLWLSRIESVYENVLPA
jgi:glycosyltransferase involved in cell wall biosynthesis